MISYFKQFLSLCSKKHKTEYFIIVILMLIGTIIELLGIGLIVPIFSLILDFENFKNYELLNNYFTFFSKYSYGTVVFLSLSLLVIVFLIKNITLVFISYKNGKFLNVLKADIERRLFVKYLNQDYLTYVSKNSSQFVSSIISEARTYASNIILSFLTLTNEILILSAILMLLIYIEPKSALFVLTSIGFVFFLLIRKTKKIVQKLGEIRLLNEQQRVQKINEGFNMFKYIKILNLENMFVDYFSVYNEKVKNAGIIQNVISQLPRRIIEFFGILILSSLILFMIYIDLPIVKIIPIIAAFSVAFYRILPGINQILVALQNLSHGISTMKLISSDLKEINNINRDKIKEKISLEKNILLQDVNFKYPGKKDYIFENINLDILKGEVIGISGETGVGKSTLTDIIMGLVPMNGGFIKLDNKTYQDNKILSSLKIGYVPQNIFLIDDTIEKNIILNTQKNSINKLNDALDISELNEFIASQENGAKTLIGENGLKISGGQKQRIGIARAIYSAPDILILDEATNGIDINKENKILKKIISQLSKMTIIIISHKSTTLEYCDKVYEIREKKVVLKKNV